MNEDLYPNDGSYFVPTEPEEQIVSKRREQSRAAAGKKEIELMITRFDKRIAFYSSIEAIDAAILDDPAVFMHTVKSNKLTVQNLVAEKEYLLSLL